MSANANHLMGMLGVTASNGRFITQTGGTGLSGETRALGDDASVMMISGLGQAAAPSSPPTNPPPVDLVSALKTPIRIGSIELPLWAWLAIAFAAGGGAGYWFGRKK